MNSSLSSNSISMKQARRLAVEAQGLNGRAAPASPVKSDLLSTFQRLGCIQIDPINVVARNPLLVLWSRLGNYDIADFEALLWEDKALFEYWAHAASIVLSEDYPIHQAQMAHTFAGDKAWAKRTRGWLAANESFRQYILDELTTRGPLFSKEFEDRSVVAWKSGGWTAGRHVGMMLGLLWEQGTITVARRRGAGFGLQKQWTLTSRHLPGWNDHPLRPQEEIVYAAAQKSLRALGVGTAKHIENHFIRNRYPDLDNVLAKLARDGRIHPIAVENRPETWYIHDEALNGDGFSADETQKAVLLSPFDNLICDRARTESLFNFHYRSEIYTPKAKRKYGYYVMPILYGDRLIGRLDPKMDRKTSTLRINAVFLEPDVEPTEEMETAVVETVSQLALFLKAEKVEYGRRVPQAWLQMPLYNLNAASDRR